MSMTDNSDAAKPCRGWAGFYADYRDAMCDAARAVLGPAGHPDLAEDAAHEALIALMTKHAWACAIASPHGLAVTAARRRAISMLRAAWHTRTATCGLAENDGIEDSDDLRTPVRLGAAGAVQPELTPDVCPQAAHWAHLHLPDVADEVCERAALAQAAGRLHLQLAALPPKHRRVVIEVVMHDQPAADLAREMQLTVARISQIKKAGLSGLRSRAAHPAAGLL